MSTSANIFRYPCVCVILVASDLLDLPKSICGVSQNRLHLLRSWRYCIASPGGCPDSAPTTSTAIPQQSQSNAIVKSDIDATAISQQSYTNPRQSHSKTGARAEIPHSNYAVLPPQLHRAISQQSCKNPTVMPEEGHNTPRTIAHAKCKFHIEI